MAIITARNKEKNCYQVFYNESPQTIFKNLMYRSLDIEIVYKKEFQRRHKNKRIFYFYMVATFLYKFKN